jgi:hypothetical protein
VSGFLCYRILDNSLGIMGIVGPMEVEQFGQWMIPKVATEDQLKIEVMARRLEITQNVGPLAASLYRSWNLQQALLQQATNEIARLELLLMKP